MKLKRPLKKIITRLRIVEEAIEDAIDELYDAQDEAPESKQEQIEDMQDELRWALRTLQDDIWSKVDEMLEEME